MSGISEEDYNLHLIEMTKEGFELNPSGYERLSSWTHVLMNLQTARSNFEIAQKHSSPREDLLNVNQHLAFFVAAIVAYCRCYASTGAAIPKLDAKKVFAGTNDGMTVHKRLINLRNTYAAHADRNDLTRVTLAVKDDGEKILIRHLITSAIPLNEMSDFIEAVAHTEHFVILSLNKQLNKLSLELGKPIFLD